MLKTHAITYKKCFTTLLFILFFIGLLPPNLMGQVKIKERVELAPVLFNSQSSLLNQPNGWWVQGCYTDTYDSSELDLRFTPESIGTGDVAVMKLYDCFYDPDCEYDEDTYNILSRNITLEPNLGSIIYLGGGEYLYSAPNTTPGDSALVVTINYENFSWGCWGKEQVSSEIKQSDDCICGTYGFSVSRHYGSKQIVIDWDSVDVQINPSEVYPGDTAQVVIKKRLPDGTLVDFPSTQTYEIAKLEGCMLGNILADGDSGSYFYDVSQPIYFAAADTLVGDSTGIVLLQVGLVDSEKKKELPAGHPKVIESNDCFLGSFLTESFKFESFPVEAAEIILIYPLDTSDDEEITNIPSMPTITCKAWLDNYHAKPIVFEWEYEVGYIYRRWNNSGTDICSRTSKSIFRGTTYGTGGLQSQWTVQFTNSQDNSFEFKGENWIDGCEQTVTEWIYGNDVFTGGEATVRIKVKPLGSNMVLATLTKKVNRIMGKNPDLPEIYAYANSNKVRAIMEEESKQFHFTDYGLDTYYWEPYDEIGWPVYGKPGGYGLMQVDNMPVPPYFANENILWNWKANISAGRIRLDLAELESLEYILKRSATNIEKNRLTNAFQSYRWGYIEEYPYKWVNGMWEYHSGENNYGENVYNKYISLGGGN